MQTNNVHGHQYGRSLQHFLYCQIKVHTLYIMCDVPSIMVSVHKCFYLDRWEYPKPILCIRICESQEFSEADNAACLTYTCDKHTIISNVHIRFFDFIYYSHKCFLHINRCFCTGFQKWYVQLICIFFSCHEVYNSSISHITLVADQ